MTEQLKEQPLEREQRQRGHVVVHHGLHCQCLTCRLDRYKKKHGQSWAPHWIQQVFQEQNGLVMGTLAVGGLLCWFGSSMWKQWKQVAYASLSINQPFSKVINSEPSVLINNVRDTIYHGMTTDPSLGITYICETAVYNIRVHINGKWDNKTKVTTTTTEEPTLLTLIVRNGLPNDSSCVLRSRQTTVCPTCSSFDIILNFKVVLHQEDYIQVFSVTEGVAEIPLIINSVDFDTTLVKSCY